MAAYFQVPLIGDGLSPDTAYRPDLPPGAVWQANIPTDASGKPTSATAVCYVTSPDAATVLAWNPAIVEVSGP